MAVVSVRTKKDGWSGGATAERNGLLYEVIRRRYRMTKLVYVNHIGDGPEVVLGGAGVPQVGDSYALFNDTDALATCISTEHRFTNNPLLREVDCEFDTDRVVSAITDNPLNQPPDVAWDFAKYEKPLMRSKDNGKAPRNSSGEYFDPPLMWEDARPTLTVTRNEASFSPTNAFQYHNALNRETFATAPPLHAKINFITGRQLYHYGLPYYQVQYQVELCRESYAYPVLDQGFRDAARSLFRDPITQQPMSTATLLNGRGQRLTSGISRVENFGGISAVDTDMLIPPSHLTRFPPGAEPVNAYGYRGSGHDVFYIRIGDEIIKVTNTFPIALPFTIERAQYGTTAAAHATDAIVTLDPYFLRYIPFDVKSYTPLALPSI